MDTITLLQKIETLLVYNSINNLVDTIYCLTPKTEILQTYNSIKYSLTLLPYSESYGIQIIALIQLNVYT